MMRDGEKEISKKIYLEDNARKFSRNFSARAFSEKFFSKYLSENIPIVTNIQNKRQLIAEFKIAISPYMGWGRGAVLFR